jgi:hypothetical protein
VTRGRGAAVTAKKASQFKMEKKKNHLPEPQNSRVFQVALLHILNSPPEIEENNHKMNDTERISSLETKPKNQRKPRLLNQFRYYH